MKMDVWQIFVLCLFFVGSFSQTYEANWTSLDKRPLPLWYDEAKFGIFCHWGVYSVPAYTDEWFWWFWKGTNTSESKVKNIDNFMHTHFDPGTTYPDMAKDFTAIDFDANYFAQIIKASGAKYFVLTTKHHEGFSLWPSNVSWNWNAMDVGAGRDLVAEVREAILNIGGIRWGTYFSLMEWFHPFFKNDQKFNTQTYPNAISYPQLIDLVTNYKPDIVWADGVYNSHAGFFPNSSYWMSEKFLAWLYNDSPVKDTVVTNDRWGYDTSCKHGGYYTCHDKYQPGNLQPYKWEDATTIDKGSWGYRRTMRLQDVNTLQELISQMVIAISTGGNFLLNIGPDNNGRVLPIFEERLRDIGAFVNAHADAIFSTKPWIYQNDANSTIWYTSSLRNSNGTDPYRIYNPQDQDNTIIYAFVLDWPEDNLVNLSHVISNSKTNVILFGAGHQNISLNFTQPFTLNGGIQVDISKVSLARFPSNVAFVLKIEYAASQNATATVSPPTQPATSPTTTTSNTNVNPTSSSTQTNASTPTSQGTQTPTVSKSSSKIDLSLMKIFVFIAFLVRLG